jgi:hypothetical protein
MHVDRRLDMEHRMGAPTPWGWIAGAVLIVVLLALAFTGGEATRTASNNPRVTTGTVPTTAPPAISVPPSIEAPSTSGQGGAQHQ